MKSRLNVSDFLGALALSVLFSGASAMTARADDATTSYISGARDLFGKNDLRGAEIQLRNALRRSPKNGEAFCWQGFICAAALRIRQKRS